MPRDRGLVWFTIIRGTDVEGCGLGKTSFFNFFEAVAPALPTALIPPVSSNSGQLGASERNEILYRS